MKAAFARLSFTILHSLRNVLTPPLYVARYRIRPLGPGLYFFSTRIEPASFSNTG